MTHYFMDSSALVKRYVPEQGTGWVRSITAERAQNVILIARVTIIEITSGLARRKREGYLSPAHARSIRLLLDYHAGRDYLGIGLSSSIVSLAQDLLEKHSLRAYDSVQLASALEARSRLTNTSLSPLLFVAGDIQLLSAASAENLTIDSPVNHLDDDS